MSSCSLLFPGFCAPAELQIGEPNANLAGLSDRSGPRETAGKIRREFRTAQAQSERSDSLVARAGRPALVATDHDLNDPSSPVVMFVECDLAMNDAHPVQWIGDHIVDLVGGRDLATGAATPILECDFWDGDRCEHRHDEKERDPKDSREDPGTTSGPDRQRALFRFPTVAIPPKTSVRRQPLLAVPRD